MFDTPGSWFQWAIRLRDSNALVGDFGLHFVDADTLEIWRQPGSCMASQGVAVLDLAFGALGRHRVFASVDPRNAPCMRLLARLGMRKEAHFCESFRDGETWVDDVIYAMLAREWQAMRREPG